MSSLSRVLFLLCSFIVLQTDGLQHPEDVNSENSNSQWALRLNKFNPDRKFQSWLEIFNLDRKPQSRSKNSIPRSFYLQALLVLQRRARSKISIHDRSLDIFSPEGRDQISLIFGPSGLLSNFCPGIFVLPKANSRGVTFLCFYCV